MDEPTHRTQELGRIPVIAVVNTSEEITELLGAYFRTDGFRVVTGYTVDIKRGTLDFEQFVEQHQPDVVLWDVAIPYEENWAFLQEVRSSPAGQRCPFIITSVNVRALRSLVGEVAVHEVIGKPYDLDALVQAVYRAMSTQLPTPDDQR